MILTKRASVVVLAVVFIVALVPVVPVQATKGKHIVIAPSGDTTGVADSNAIENALRTVPQGGTVELKEGRFYASRVMVVEDFAGTLKGAGKGKTIIEAIENSEPGSYLFYDPYYDAQLTSVFFFPNPKRNVQISDLTAEVNTAIPADKYLNPWGGLVNALNSIFYITATSDLEKAFNTVVSHVRIQGAPGDFAGQNIAFSLYISNYAASKHSFHVVENCDFENIGGNALEHYPIPGASVIIKSNTFKNLGWGAYSPYLCDFVEFSDNTITDVQYYGIYIDECNSGFIYDNLFSDITGSLWFGQSSIILDESRNFMISNNAFVNARGIRLVYGCSHNVIVGNDYRQSGLPGWVKTDTFPSKYGCVWLMGDIFGYPPTVENLVMEWLFPEGTTLTEQVLDEGVDNLVLMLP
jgi:hypothetical protein